MAYGLATYTADGFEQIAVSGRLLRYAAVFSFAIPVSSSAQSVSGTFTGLANDGTWLLWVVSTGGNVYYPPGYSITTDNFTVNIHGSTATAYTMYVYIFRA